MANTPLLMPMPATAKGLERTCSGRDSFKSYVVKLAVVVLALYMASSYLLLLFGGVTEPTALITEIDSHTITPSAHISALEPAQGVYDSPDTLPLDGLDIDEALALDTDTSPSSPITDPPQPDSPQTKSDTAVADSSTLPSDSSTPGAEQESAQDDHSSASAAAPQPQTNKADVDREHGDPESSEGNLVADATPSADDDPDLDIDSLEPAEATEMGSAVVPDEHADALAQQRRCDALVDGYNMLNADTIPAEKCKEIERECAIASCKSAMDVVVLWVNGSDPEQVCVYAHTRTGTHRVIHTHAHTHTHTYTHRASLPSEIVPHIHTHTRRT